MTELQMLGNSFCEFGLVSTYQRFCFFDPKVHLFLKYFFTKVNEWTFILHYTFLSSSKMEMYNNV